MSPTNEPRMTKAERTAQAREKAKIIRDAQLKKEKRNSWMIRGGVVVAALVIIAIIALVVINVPPMPTAAPTSVTDPGAIGIAASASGKPAQVVVYLDFMCPACNGFEQNYGPALDELRNAEKITVEYRALPFLDRFSSGTNYSSRSAAAASCVVDQSPDKYKAFVDALFTNQPAENSKGLDNATLEKFAKETGAADISSCISEKTYRPFVAYVGAVAGSAGVNATPTAFVDGQQWMPETDKDFMAFVNTIVDAKK